MLLLQDNNSLWNYRSSLLPPSSYCWSKSLSQQNHTRSVLDKWKHTLRVAEEAPHSTFKYHNHLISKPKHSANFASIELKDCHLLLAGVEIPEDHFNVPNVPNNPDNITWPIKPN